MPTIDTRKLGVIDGKIRSLTITKPTMGTMLQGSLRAPVTRLITPLCRGLIRLGITANVVTITGSFLTVLAALVFFPSGQFLSGTALIIFFVLFDLLDGTLARLSPNGGTAFGALLDSTLDRVTDSAVLGTILIYLIRRNDGLIPVMLIAIVASFLVSYVKARAEAVGIVCNGGLAERTERLAIILLATTLTAFGFSSALAIGIWLLALASSFTVLQRLAIVYRAAN
jgi:CDP-diacylglycerol--glycerol-3-phosphate 3-phosphatidyltransferase